MLSPTNELRMRSYVLPPRHGKPNACTERRSMCGKTAR